MSAFDWQKKYEDLLARARHPATPGPEAKSCLEKAADLAVKYRLSETGSQRPDTPPGVEHIRVMWTSVGVLMQYDVVLVQAAAELFGCSSYALYHHLPNKPMSDELWIAGRPDMAVKAAEFFSTTQAAMANLMGNNARRGDMYKVGFAFGVAEAVGKSLENTCQALVLSTVRVGPEDIMKRHPEIDESLAPPHIEAPTVDSIRDQLDALDGSRDGRSFAGKIKEVNK